MAKRRYKYYGGNISVLFVAHFLLTLVNTCIVAYSSMMWPIKYGIVFVLSLIVTAVCMRFVSHWIREYVVFDLMMAMMWWVSGTIIMEDRNPEVAPSVLAIVIPALSLVLQLVVFYILKITRKPKN